MSEERLLADARRGNEAAFELLVGRHRRELYAHCHRMLGSVQDAEDAVQEAGGRVREGVGAGRRPGPARPAGLRRPVHDAAAAGMVRRPRGRRPVPGRAHVRHAVAAGADHRQRAAGVRRVPRPPVHRHFPVPLSLDGYVTGPGDNVMALPMDDFFDAHNLERLRAADTLLLGATTYMGLKSYWPAVAADPTVSPAVAANPEVADVHRQTGERNNVIDKVVVSDSLSADDTAPWTGTTTIVRRAEAHRAVADLKDRPGTDILMFGSRTLWNDLLAAGLVDELHLMLGATVLGGGTPAFGAGPVPPLRLVDTRRRDGSDNLLLRYAVVNRDS